MKFHTTSSVHHNTMIAFVIVIAFLVQLVLAVPVTIEPSSGRHLLLSQQQQQQQDQQQQKSQQQNDTGNPILARREVQAGDGTTTTSSSAEDVGDGGSNEVEVDDGDGTFSNDTQAGSRLVRNETEPCSLEPAILCSVDPTHSNRDKQRRIAHIVNFLWTNLFENRTRPVNREVTRERFSPVNPSSSSFSGGLESISASCDLPPEVESEAWSSERYFSLFFNLSSKYPDILGSVQQQQSSSSAENSSSSSSAEPPQQQQQQQREEVSSFESGHSQEYVPMIGSRPFLTTLTVTPTKSVNIISAKLRLYKIGTSENTVPSSVSSIERISSEPCNDTDVNSDSSSDEEVLPSVFPTTRMTFPEFSPSVDEKIRVSVFWYTQPATKNHYKKKLVDAKMFSMRESSWVEFDIKNAVTAWLNERKPNYGLVIEVENENQDALDPRIYFRGTPCFKSASTSEGTNHHHKSNGNRPGNERSGRDANAAMSPILEICTLNVPQSKTNYEPGKFPFSINVHSLNHLKRVAESHAASKSTNSSSRPKFSSSHNLRPEDFGIIDPRVNSNNEDQSEVPRQTIVVSSHRHRHHHQLAPDSDNTNNNNNNQREESTEENRRHQRGKGRSDHHPQQFGKDHPLRQILASVNGNSKESSKRNSGSRQLLESFEKAGFPTNLVPEMPADEGRAEAADYNDSTEHDRDVYITKIIISPAQLKENALNGFANRRGFLPFASSMATSSSSTPSSAVSPTRSTNVDSSER